MLDAGRSGATGRGECLLSVASCNRHELSEQQLAFKRKLLEIEPDKSDRKALTLGTLAKPVAPKRRPWTSATHLLQIAAHQYR